MGKSLPIFRNRVKPQNQKYFCFSETKSGVWSARLTRQEGRLAIVTNVRWDAVDADVTTDDRGFSRTVKSCGPGAPMLALSAREVSRGWRWQESRSPGRARSKP